MASQESLDRAYMECALAIAKLSHATRKKVGAIIVSGKKELGVIAEGFNGTPSGFDNDCEMLEIVCVHDFQSNYQDQTFKCSKCNKVISWQEEGYTPVVADRYITKPEVLHAESNAIAKLAMSTNSGLGATLYVTAMPCIACSKMIIQCGIKRVVYLEKYISVSGGDGGEDLLKRAGIEVVQLATKE